ncbi:MAG: lamin tail domain-containing protein [Myxococcaceae bacterium]|nr:lamin tail domain-containing protein [Myxococcaceae bacterium]
MTLRSGVFTALLFTLAACPTPQKPPPPPSPPAITSFTVDKSAIRRGERVTFNFTVERAKSVEIIDQTGANVSTTFDDLAGVGSAQATPTRSSFYVLRAEGEGGRDGAFVQVAVDEGLQSVFLVVVPQQTRPGERVDLLWSAAGGRNVRLTAGARMLSTMESGSATELPTTTTTYTLSGERADGSLSTQSATVTVIPVIESFTATPPAAKQGETITLAWKTAGAETVVVEEATFGQLVSTSMNVEMGTVDFVVPSFFADAGFFDAGTPDPDAGVLPDGGTLDAGPPAQPPVPAVRDGFPLRFTLRASTAMPPQEAVRAIDSRVGQGPIIDFFEVPEYGTRGRPLTFSWRTTGANRIELQANGLTVYSPLPNVNTSGSFRLGTFSADTSFTLVAYDFNGLQVSLTKAVRVVPPPRIIEFTAPAATATATMKVTVNWRTADTTFILLRLKNAPAFFREDAMLSVANGSRQFTVPIRGTYVLEAYNLAGDRATEERTIDVGAPITFSVTPDLLAKGEQTTVTWDVSQLSPTDMLGLPGQPPAVTQNSTAFDDLTNAPTARALFFANRDNDIAVLNLPNGFTFPFVTRLATQLSVSTNGFVAVGTGASAAPTNLDLSDPGYSGPALLAPFWDDLDLGAQGRVLWNLDEALYPRRLTIQWDKVRRAGAMGSELTFQVQLYETGEFLFAWKKLDGPGADGSDATIGAVDGVDAYQGLVSFNSATSAELAIDTDRSWFNNQPELSSSRQYRLRGFSSLGFVLEVPGEYIPVYGRARAFGANDVIVSEAMPAPLPTVTEGQWVELENPQPSELDVSGLRLESVSGATMPFVLPADTVIDAGAFFVLGQSTDPSANGDAGVRLAWSMGTVGLTTPDTVRLVVPTVQADGGTLVISRLSWGAKSSLLPDGGADPDAGVAEGISVQPPENVLVRSGAPPFSCPRTGTFGPPTQTGTPGAVNEQCFPYILSEIPLDFEDVSSGPSVAFPSNDDSATQVPLAVPFPYFGQSFTQMRVCTNGWVSFVDTTSSSLSNKGLPSATTPVQTLAVFWDDLIIRNTMTSAAYVSRGAGKTIIQYKNFEVFGVSGDNLNFEIKLFDNGVIEYHYGSMVGSRSNGNSATRWIDNLDGTAALAISVRTGTTSQDVGPLVVPNTAFRFTPRAALGSTP